MSGQDLFMWVIEQVPAVAYQALEKSGLAIDELDAFMPHEANRRMTECLAKALDPPERIVVANDIEHQGNTSAASIPLAMAQTLDTNLQLHGGTALLVVSAPASPSEPKSSCFLQGWFARCATGSKCAARRYGYAQA